MFKKKNGTPNDRRGGYFRNTGYAYITIPGSITHYVSIRQGLYQTIWNPVIPFLIPNNPQGILTAKEIARVGQEWDQVTAVVNYQRLGAFALSSSSHPFHLTPICSVIDVPNVRSSTLIFTVCSIVNSMKTLTCLTVDVLKLNIVSYVCYWNLTTIKQTNNNYMVQFFVTLCWSKNTQSSENPSVGQRIPFG